MGRKAFKVGNIVVGKTKQYRNKRGKVLASGVGQNGNLTRVRWTCGKVDEVTSYAIDVESMAETASPEVDSASGEEVDESDEGGDWTSQYGNEEGGFVAGEVSLRINRCKLDLAFTLDIFLG